MDRSRVYLSIGNVSRNSSSDMTELRENKFKFRKNQQIFFVQNSEVCVVHFLVKLL